MKFNMVNAKKVVAISLVLVVSALSALTIYAKSTNTTIDIAFRNIKLVVDNQKVYFGKDSEGNQIEPFIHNGTTYLPVRAVAEALGKDVAWDGNTHTVYIGKRRNVSTSSRLNEDIPFMSKKGSFSSNEKGGTMIKDIGNNTYSYYLYTDWDGLCYVDFPLDGEYKTFKGTVGWHGEKKFNKRDSKVSIFADDKLVETYILKAGEGSKEISADVKGADKIRIQFDGEQSAVMFDPIVYK